MRILTPVVLALFIVGQDFYPDRSPGAAQYAFNLFPQPWTNMPAADADIYGGVVLYIKADLSKYRESRFIATVYSAGAVNADIRVEYATSILGPWSNLTAEVPINPAIFANATAWTALPSDAKTDVFLRVRGKDGDGVADPGLGALMMEFR